MPFYLQNILLQNYCIIKQTNQIHKDMNNWTTMKQINEQN